MFSSGNSSASFSTPSGNSSAMVRSDFSLSGADIKMMLIQQGFVYGTPDYASAFRQASTSVISPQSFMPAAGARLQQQYFMPAAGARQPQQSFMPAATVPQQPQESFMPAATVPQQPQESFMLAATVPQQPQESFMPAAGARQQQSFMPAATVPQQPQQYFMPAAAAAAPQQQFSPTINLSHLPSSQIQSTDRDQHDKSFVLPQQFQLQLLPPTQHQSAASQAPQMTQKLQHVSLSIGSQAQPIVHDSSSVPSSNSFVAYGHSKFKISIYLFSVYCRRFRYHVGFVTSRV